MPLFELRPVKSDAIVISISGKKKETFIGLKNTIRFIKHFIRTRRRAGESNDLLWRKVMLGKCSTGLASNLYRKIEGDKIRSDEEEWRLSRRKGENGKRKVGFDMNQDSDVHQSSWRLFLRKEKGTEIYRIYYSTAYLRIMFPGQNILKKKKYL